MTTILDGKKLANKIKAKMKSELSGASGRPSLAIVLIGENAPSEIYTREKVRACEEVGIAATLHKLPAKTNEEAVVEFIEELNASSVDGILVQLPLPKQIDEKNILQAVDPSKDVDCLNPVNLGNLLIGNETIAPCTPKGIVRLLEAYKIPIEGSDAVIINNSNIVGKPLAAMLTNRFATVTVCHVKTKKLEQKTKQADILITATGVPGLVKKNMVKKRATVIDAGIKHVAGKVVGDVDFNAVRAVAKYITPVPGGVGPMTVAMVLENLLILANMKKV